MASHITRQGGPPAAPAAPDRTRTLRLSVTDRCDLRCRYCLPGGRAPFLPAAELRPLPDLLGAVAWLARRFGVDRLKLTGGEPLTRAGLVPFVRAAAALPGIREVSATTNGTRLAALAEELADAGLARVNVSLDTLDAGRFRDLTRGGDVARVLAGIDAALAAGLAPVKLNAVLRRSSWREDVPALLDFAAERGLEIRFIELMRTGSEVAWAEREFVAAAEVRSALEREGAVLPLPTPLAAPARRTLVRRGAREVAVGWITPVTHPFCGACDRLRLDARGALRRCLMDEATVPLVEWLRAGDDGAAVERVERYLACKRPPPAMEIGVPMRGIGG